MLSLLIGFLFFIIELTKISIQAHKGNDSTEIQRQRSIKDPPFIIASISKF